MSCGCGKQRTRNVEKLWATIAALERQLAEVQGKLDAVRELALEGACSGCVKKMDEACIDEGCNWARQFLRILSKEEE